MGFFEGSETLKERDENENLLETVTDGEDETERERGGDREENSGNKSSSVVLFLSLFSMQIL